MEIKEFIENVKDQFEDAPDTFGADTKFRELEDWSSLVSLSIIAMVDDEYDVVIKAADIKNVETVGQLFELVNGRCNG